MKPRRPKTCNRNCHTSAVTALYLPICGAPLVKVAHFLFFFVFAVNSCECGDTNSTSSTFVFSATPTRLHLPMFFYNFLQMRVLLSLILLIITFSTKYNKCRIYIMLCFSVLCCSDTCRTCFGQVYMFRTEKKIRVHWYLHFQRNCFLLGVPLRVGLCRGVRPRYSFTLQTPVGHLQCYRTSHTAALPYYP